MGITIQGATNQWTNKQWNVIYEGSNAPVYPQVLGTLVKATDGSTYYSGRILSIITVAHATNPDLVGMFLNYDPTSSNPDQLVPTHVISDQWVNGVYGLDDTNQTTQTNTYNQINVSPFLIGTTFYYKTLTDQNPAGVITGFNAYYKEATITNIQLNGAECPVITIQGVN